MQNIGFSRKILQQGACYLLENTKCEGGVFLAINQTEHPRQPYQWVVANANL